MALIPGEELPDEYVIIGAHYDHLDRAATPPIRRHDLQRCHRQRHRGGGRALDRRAARPGPRPQPLVDPRIMGCARRTACGGRAWIADPLVPMAQTVAYVSYDIQGANILPTLRNTTFAIGAETGGDRLQRQRSERAVRPGSLDTQSLSWIFGQGRSDYLPFIQAGVPTVFFSDSTGPCYHTAQDEAGVVDYGKLNQQVLDGVRLA